MSELIKKPYEISLWGERIEKQTGKTTNEKGEEVEVVLNSYTKEYKIATIGSDTMESPIKAFEPKLVRQTNGTNTLTFQIFYRYYDIEENKFKLNPFISLLSNERKIKLKYEEKWYDFVIKQVQEDSQKETFTYTCQDLYIAELSKNGYSLIFDTELENNMGSVTELGTEVLKGTEWSIDEKNSDILIQKNEEALFTYELEEDLINPKIITIEDGKLTETISELTIEKGDIILIGYSSYKNWKEGKSVFFYWVRGGRYEIDDDRIITNSPIYSFIPPVSFSNTFLKITSTYRGNFPVSSRKMKYIPEIKRYCYEYTKNGELYYAFVGSEFLSVVNIQNLLTNSNNFTSDFGWFDVGGQVSFNKDTRLLELDFSKGLFVRNSGLSDSLALFQEYNGVSVGDSFILLIKAEYEGEAQIDKCYIHKELLENNFLALPVSSCEKLENTLVEGYDSFKITFTKSFSYQELVSNPLHFYLNSSRQRNGKIYLEDIKFFKEVNITYQIKDDNETISEVTETFIPDIPNLRASTETAIKDKYFFFNAQELNKIITNIDDITFTGKYFEDEIPDSFIEVSKKNPYEKITSITASKSNRFNLIQELCETFECWTRFEIGHDQIGAVKHVYRVTQDTSEIQGKKYYTWKDGIAESDKNINDPTLFVYTDFADGVYEHILDKKVVFKQYIGKDNYAGFRYGINLKGITRDIDSKQIVTKLIVESNSNQYAEDGFCSIQRATMNPTRENAIYNFKYYINNGLIDKDELTVDLYDEDSIGLYPKLLEINLAAEPGIAKLVELKTARDKALAAYTYHKFAKEEAENNATEYQKQINDFTGGKGPSTGKEYNDTIKELQRKLEYANSAISKHLGSLTYYKEIYDKYEEQVIALETSLATYTEQKEQLYSEFFKKYSRFVQEGTWISEEYFDPDLYYFDACKVSETSAFPQVTYNINVLDLSGMEEYQNYKFEIGDKTYIEDTEFFGYNQETGRPYQEEVIISEIHSFLDSPGKDVIKVKNYKTRFEDLFQRVAAATQALQYHEGEYNRASSAIKKDNTIDGSVLERTLNYNYVLSDAISKEIAQGGQVIDLNSVSQPNRYVRLSGLGIQLSKDGGLNWQTAITADGINADVGVFGSLHTNNLTIYNGDTDAFFWNADGITAFGMDNNGTQYNKFVRFSKYGIYGHIGEYGYEHSPKSINDIVDNSVFSLTWNGFALNSLNNGNYVRISTEGKASETIHGNKIIWAGKTISGTPTDQFIVYEDGSIFANSGEFKGDITGASGTFSGTISATKGSIGGWTIGRPEDSTETWNGLSNGNYGLYSIPRSVTINKKTVSVVFQAGTNFYVDSSGYLTATGATFSGTLTSADGYFSGELSAASGTFKGELTAETINTLGTFKILDRTIKQNVTEEITYGFIGKAQGSRPNPVEGQPAITTYGVCLTQGTPSGGYLDATNTGAGAGQYVVVTDGGVRLQAGANSVTVTSSGAFYNKGGVSKEIGSGTAVFG